MADDATTTASSDYTYGTKVTEKEIPNTKYRRIYDGGLQFTDRVKKRAEDTLNYVLDMRRWLTAKEKIEQVRAISDPDDLLIPYIYYSETRISMWLAGGDDETYHDITMRVSMSSGQVKLIKLAVTTYGDAPDYSTITVTFDSVTTIQQTTPATTIEGIATADPTSVDFGEVDLDDVPKTATVRITNTGTDELDIMALELEETDDLDTDVFSFSASTPARMDVDDYFDVIITLDGNKTGVYAQSLMLDKGKGSTELLTITATLTQEGVVSTSITVSVSDGVIGTSDDYTDSGDTAGASISVSADSVSFDDLDLNSDSSETQTITITNNSDDDSVTISGITSDDDSFSGSVDSTTIAAGGTATLTITFAPSAAGDYSGDITIASDADNSSITVGVEGSATKATSTAALTATSLAFGTINLASATSKTMTVTLANTGDESFNVTSLTDSNSVYSSTIDSTTIEGNGSATITVVLTPTAAGSYSSTLTIVTDADNNSTLTVQMTATVVETVLPLSTSGNQIVNAAGEVVRLKSVNWAGAETTNYIPGGIWEVSYKDLIADIVDMGFNCVRIPFSGETFDDSLNVAGVDGSISDNEDFIASGTIADGDAVYVDPITAMKTIIAELWANDIFVVLDYHQNSAGSTREGTPVSGSQTQATWVAQWEAIATEFADVEGIIGCDLYNEPYNLTWSAWNAYATAAAEAINDIQPDWLMIVEGVFTYTDSDSNTDTYWYGGNLMGVSSNPISLSFDNKLVYSPHEYGQSVESGQSWLAYSGSEPDDWPDNLYDVWDQFWGFIYYNEIAPVWIGEFGGKFGVDGSGDANSDTYADYEKQWLANLITYINGDQDGDGTSDIDSDVEGISFSYWELNPNSSDTGGLLEDDWETYQSTKLALLSDLLS